MADGTPVSASRAVDEERLWNRLMELARCGALPGGGVNRQALTEPEVQARLLLARWAEELGLPVLVDEIGNFFVRRHGTDPSAAPVMTGSHIDTVPAGGRFDGSYGVLAGFEVLQALEASATSTRRPVEVAVWTNEEGARFAPGQMGSAAFVGARRLADILAMSDRDGVTVAQALEPILAATPRAARRPLGTPVAAFVEAHIEQGPALEAAGCTIGVVTGIQGRRSFLVDVQGEAAHGGTAPQSARRDALLAATAMIHDLERAMRDPQDRVRFTVGAFDVEPNAPLVVPARVRFTVDVRHPENAVMERLGDQVGDICLRHARGCVVSVTENARAPSISFSEEVVNTVESAASRLGLRHMRIFSLAGHDSRELFKVCPTGMIFVPCKAGVSHNEAESATAADLAAGARVLAEVVVELANR
ncbi:MAG: hydantoinase/carbamoylase family amidase [Betaproteobacteria bacterium]|nr:hydantoinase/carbamoylase family amidase [Betaproteobacteria bacterium]